MLHVCDFEAQVAQFPIFSAKPVKPIWAAPSSDVLLSQQPVQGSAKLCTHFGYLLPVIPLE
jgi:hypothetical protein